MINSERVSSNPRKQSMLSEVSEADPHSSCTQKYYQLSRSTNFINTTKSAMRNKRWGHKDLFYRRLGGQSFATKVATKAQWILLSVEELFRMWVYSTSLPPSRVFFQPLPQFTKLTSSLAEAKRNMHKLFAAHRTIGSSPDNTYPSRS
jgi:hypothetical protein